MHVQNQKERIEEIEKRSKEYIEGIFRIIGENMDIKNEIIRKIQNESNFYNRSSRLSWENQAYLKILMR